MQDASIRSAEFNTDESEYCASICAAALQALRDSGDVRDRLVAAGFSDGVDECRTSDVAAADAARDLEASARALVVSTGAARAPASSSGSSGSGSGGGKDVASHPLNLRSKARRSGARRDAGAAASAGGGALQSLRATVSFAQGSVSVAPGLPPVVPAFGGRQSGALCSCCYHTDFAVHVVAENPCAQLRAR